MVGQKRKEEFLDKLLVEFEAKSNFIKVDIGVERKVLRKHITFIIKYISEPLGNILYWLIFSRDDSITE